MWSLLLAGEFKGGSFTGWFERSIESIFCDIYSQNQAFMAYIMHQKCKVQVIGWHVHKIMMIPITRNHQEGEEHARRSSVSSSVRWSIEGIVLKKYQVCVCVHRSLLPTFYAILCELCCDAPRTTTIVL